ncbi:potassium voltage-gated channel protein Shal-like isoform X3 [Apis florea]|uniref:potassium voltage-gated channel protein Shal-like isoform X3 n=1 Tax=Apis florea TaxID=7463 RepID=UPI0012FF59A0|nr:potassium voltage-gated channel protein Shal-like isoform X3 [Apis florea]
MKARLARIRIAKASSGAAFVSKKKAAEARLAAQESGLQLDDNYKEEDIFELQHHHLLRCLEKTTDREFVEMEVPYNGAPKRPGSPSPLTSPAHSTASRGGLLHACCGRCYPQRYQFHETTLKHSRCGRHRSGSDIRPGRTPRVGRRRRTKKRKEERGGTKSLLARVVSFSGIYIYIIV